MSNLSDTGSLARHTLFTLIIGTLITLSLLVFMTGGAWFWTVTAVSPSCQNN
uniref:Uncharacterized protein n=1 Tax=Anguilla anguilla TaxID=7936 RepID=A0A0E9PZN8_ANGAN